MPELGVVRPVSLLPSARTGSVPSGAWPGRVGRPRPWTGATVPYELDATLPESSRVTDAMTFWQAITSLRFVRRTEFNATAFPDYVRFVPDTRCWAAVGMAGGRQEVAVSNECTTGDVMHAIAHTIGLWHQPDQSSRDAVVLLVRTGTELELHLHLERAPADEDADLTAPAAQCSSTAFVVTGRVTMQPARPAAGAPAPTGLSAGDIVTVNAMYAPVRRQPTPAPVEPQRLPRQSGDAPRGSGSVDRWSEQLGQWWGNGQWAQMVFPAGQEGEGGR